MPRKAFQPPPPHVRLPLALSEALAAVTKAVEGIIAHHADLVKELESERTNARAWASHVRYWQDKAEKSERSHLSTKQRISDRYNIPKHAL